MGSLDDRIAKRLAEIKEEQTALDHADAAREAELRDAEARGVRRKAGFLPSFLFLTGVLVLAAGLLGVAVTLGRLSAHDMADARREGQATVNSCVTRGPVTNHGYGYWEACEAEVVWADGEVERTTVSVVFGSADIGRRPIQVGDLGYDNGSRKLARADVAPRPWLEWIGIGVAVIAFLPTLVGVLLLREVLRFRKK